MEWNFLTLVQPPTSVARIVDADMFLLLSYSMCFVSMEKYTCMC